MAKKEITKEDKEKVKALCNKLLDMDYDYEVWVYRNHISVQVTIPPNMELFNGEHKSKFKQFEKDFKLSLYSEEHCIKLYMVLLEHNKKC